MSREHEYANSDLSTVDQIHKTALIKEFKRNKGNRALIISPSFPFFFIGRIKKVVGDHAFLYVETTPIQELEDRIWVIHITRIELFFIEKEGGPRLPELDDHIC